MQKAFNCKFCNWFARHPNGYIHGYSHGYPRKNLWIWMWIWMGNFISTARMIMPSLFSSVTSCSRHISTCV